MDWFIGIGKSYSQIFPLQVAEGYQRLPYSPEPGNCTPLGIRPAYQNIFIGAHTVRYRVSRTSPRLS